MARTKKDGDKSVRTMSETEIAELHGDTEAPAGYSNNTLKSEAPAATSEAPAAPAADKTPPPPAESPAAGVDPKAPPAAPPPPTDEAFTRIERELAKKEGEEDLSKFSKTERAYFHQMKRDRKARQDAEAQRDTVLRENLRLKNPPPPPPDPFAGKAEDDVLSVKEVKELLAKTQPPPPPPPPDQSVQARAKHYLLMCEKEARAAHPDDFDAVMDLTDLVDGDAAILKEISERTAQGENPAEVMYQAIRKHKDFEALLPAAQTRVQARKSEPAAAPPASPNPAVPATPEDKAKIDKANQAQAALENNGNRPRTTAHASAREGKPAEELTLEEITSMSDNEFARLPRHVRQRYLKQHGA